MVCDLYLQTVHMRNPSIKGHSTKKLHQPIKHIATKCNCLMEGIKRLYEAKEVLWEPAYSGDTVSDNTTGSWPLSSETVSSPSANKSSHKLSLSWI